jgi:plasmid stabilization system protein ParE
MNVVYHPQVQQDVSKILRHYDSINPRLGDEFWAELNSFIQKAADHPGRFHLESPVRRRVNLHRFPYHFLFREIAGGIRISVVRGHKQHPATGTQRR